MSEEINCCEECGSDYWVSSSSLNKLCPNCASELYGYENCAHEFNHGRCIHCFWDGSISDYIKTKPMEKS